MLHKVNRERHFVNLWLCIAYEFWPYDAVIFCSKIYIDLVGDWLWMIRFEISLLYKDISGS